MLIGLFFFSSQYVHQKKQNSLILDQNNTYIERLKNLENISKQLIDYRNDPYIPRLNFNKEVSDQIVNIFLGEVDYRFVVEWIKSEDLSVLWKILSSVEKAEEVDLRFHDIEELEALSITWDLLDKNNIRYLSITFSNENTNLQLWIIQDVLWWKHIESYSFYNVLINQELLDYMEELDIYSLTIEWIYNSDINDQKVAQAMQNSWISEFNINNLMLQGAWVSNWNWKIILEKN